jgi:hypothetical protein
MSRAGGVRSTWFVAGVLGAGTVLAGARAAGAVTRRGPRDEGGSIASVPDPGVLELPGPVDLPGRGPAPRTLGAGFETLGFTFAPICDASTCLRLDLDLPVDTDRALFPGESFLVDIESADVRGPGDTGMFISTSGLEPGDNIDRVAEVWYPQIFADGLVRVKGGKIDTGLEFAYITPGETFVHSASTSLCTGGLVPMCRGLAMGAGVFVCPTAGGYSGAGLLDAGLFDGTCDGDGRGGGGGRDGVLVSWLDRSNRRGLQENESDAGLVCRVQLTPFERVAPGLPRTVSPPGHPPPGSAVTGVLRFEVDY